jgi:hypothetical protein
MQARDTAADRRRDGQDMGTHLKRDARTGQPDAGPMIPGSANIDGRLDLEEFIVFIGHSCF